jgi:hypothetical protein
MPDGLVCRRIRIEDQRVNLPIDKNAAIRFLLAAQGPAGGWGYRPGTAASVEPTAACLLALRDLDTAANARAAGLSWLQRTQRADGGWAFAESDTESGWQTAWAMLALRGAPDAAAPLARGRDWLLAAGVVRSETDQLQAEVRRQLAIDFTLRGLPWLPDQASWVEPTALGLLALVAAPSNAESVARVTEASRFLIDRRCKDGGWNFGNPFMLGAYLPPRAFPTALALLALAAVDPAAVEARDTAVLGEEMTRDGGALALAAGLLALRRLKRAGEAFSASLAKLQLADGSWNGSPFHTAMALLADGGAQ